MSSASRARQIHRTWHKRDADVCDDLVINWPDDMAEIGEAINIVYSSDKWNTPGDFEDYTHACTSRAPVFEYRSSHGDVSIEDLLKAHGRGTTDNVTGLADMVELEYRRASDGKRVKHGFRDSGANFTYLACLNDKKTLVILRPSGRATIITGSRMKITAHGIVH